MIHLRRRATAIWNAPSDSSVRQFTQEHILIPGLSPFAFAATFGSPTLFDRLSERLHWRAAGPDGGEYRGCGTNIGAARAAVSPALSGTLRQTC
jgi:hypothetical protein